MGDASQPGPAASTLDRVVAFDPARVVVDRARAGRALQAHLAAMGLPPRPVRWVAHPADAPMLGEIVPFCPVRAAFVGSLPAQVRPLADLFGWLYQTSGANLFGLIGWTLGYVASDVDRWDAEAAAGLHRGYVALRQSGSSDLAYAPIALPMVEALEAGLFGFLRLADEVLAVPLPRLRLDPQRQLHGDDGPAVVWPSPTVRARVRGWRRPRAERPATRVWFWHGVRVRRHVVERPGRIRLAEIDAEPNTEVQRVLIERFGWERFDALAGAKIVDHDERFGTLMRRAMPRGPDLLYLRVVNRTPEPDGGFRRYLLPLEPDLRPIPDTAAGETWFGPAQALTARNAVASTFGLTGDAYAPAGES